jgi:hypothetical protein
MKLFTFLFCCGISSLLLSQKLKYKCTSPKGKTSSILVTPASQPLNYLGKDIYINKVDVNLGPESVASFYSYKYNNNLYVLDKNCSKLNPSKDPVLFSIPYKETFRLNLPEVFENAGFLLLKYTSINGEKFYKYEVSSQNSNFKTSEIIFDKDLDINELKFSAKGHSCSCTKSNITIRLRQR